ncbi:MAG: hypothetical protein GY832_36290 [Chloroflexi bacterium]|nr:hypothetical protein [Chloroflexota bacterium]
MSIKRVELQIADVDKKRHDLLLLETSRRRELVQAKSIVTSVSSSMEPDVLSNAIGTMTALELIIAAIKMELESLSNKRRHLASRLSELNSRLVSAKSSLDVYSADVSRRRDKRDFNSVAAAKEITRLKGVVTGITG